ncbi:MAG: MMPL family transporter, partial [Spirochaetales bacterium]|nr:MMPL family transporter [Spirochaetales bacterium]
MALKAFDGNFSRNMSILIVILILLGTVFWGVIASNTKIEMGTYTLLPDQDEDIIKFNRISKNFGGFDNIILVLKGSDKSRMELFANEINNKASDFTNTILSVDYRIPVDFFTDNFLLYAGENDYREIISFLNKYKVILNRSMMKKPEGTQFFKNLQLLVERNTELRKQIKRWDLSGNSNLITSNSGNGSSLTTENGYYYIGSSNRMILFLRPTNPNHDMFFFKEMTADVNTILGELKPDYPEISVDVNGMAKMMEEQQSLLNNRILIVSLLSLVGIVILFMAAFKRVWSSLIASIPVLIAIVWTLGINQLVIGRLNLVTSIFAVILLGLGIDFSIHFVSHYFHEIDKGKSHFDAVAEVFKNVVPGIAAGAITTAAAFFLLMFSEFKGIKELGFIAGTGILMCLVLVLIILPVILRVLKTRSKTTADNGISISRIYTKFLNKKKIAVLSVLLIVMAVPYFTGFNIGYNYNAFELLPEIPSVLRQRELIKEMGMSFEYSIVSTKDIAEAGEVYEKLKKSGRYSLIDSPSTIIPTGQDLRIEEVRKFLRENSSIAEYLPVLSNYYRNSSSLNINPSELEMKLVSFWGILSENLLGIKDYGPVTFESLPDQLKNKYLGKDGSLAIFVYGKPDMWDEAEMKGTVRELTEIHPESTGTPFMWVKLVEYIRSDLVRSSSLVFFAILLIVSLVFRNVKYIFIVMSPVLAGFAFLLGYMSFFEISFNAANITAFPLILGIAVDDGIHMVQSYISDPDKSISTMLQKSGKAVIITSLTTMIGFGSLYFVHDPLVSGLGILLFFGTLFSLAASITFVPLLLLVLYRKVMVE